MTSAGEYHNGVLLFLALARVQQETEAPMQHISSIVHDSGEVLTTPVDKRRIDVS